MLTDEQLRQRKTGIGASEVSALMGLDPYRSKLDIYLSKMGLVDDAPSFHKDRGNFLEPALREWASAKTGLHFVGGCKTLVCKDHPRVLATPDGMATGDSNATHVLELKSPGPRAAMEWGEDEDGAPDRYVVQLCDQMLCANAPIGHLGALVDGDLRMFRYERDAELEGEIIIAVEKFWRDHIVKMVAPPVDGSPCADVWLKKRFPRSNVEMVTADGKTEELLFELRDVRARLAECKEKNEVLEQRVKEIIGDKAGITCVNGKVTYKNNKDTEVINWHAIAAELGAVGDIVTRHTTTKPGPRSFRFNVK